MPSSASPSPPLSTLFPYTTLFRSFPVRDGDHRRGDDRCGTSGLGRARRRLWLLLRSDTEHGLIERGPRSLAGGNWGPLRLLGTFRVDRKSTRLNSSHQIISYAVFCFTVPSPLHALSLHDALPIFSRPRRRSSARR